MTWWRFRSWTPPRSTSPSTQATNFQDLETHERPAGRSRRKYTGAYREQSPSAHIDALGKGFGKHGVDHVLLNTAEPLDEALYAYLVLPPEDAENPVRPPGSR